MLGQRADGELLDDLQRSLADHVNRVAHAVRHVHERRIAADDRAEVARGVGAVDVHDGAAAAVLAGGGRGPSARVEVGVLDELLARMWLDPQPASSSAPSAQARAAARTATHGGRPRTFGTVGARSRVWVPSSDPHKGAVRLSTRSRQPGFRAISWLGSPPSAVHSLLATAPRCAGRRPHAGAAPRRRAPRTRPPAAHAHASGAARGPPRRRRPATLVYRPRYLLPAPLKDPAFAVVGAGRFALLGGLDSSEVSSAGIEVADLHGVVRTASLPLAQHDAQGAQLGGEVYVFGGGSSTELDHIVSFDPAAGGVQHRRRAAPSPVRRRGRRDRRDRVRGRRLRRHELAEHDPRVAAGLAGAGGRAPAGRDSLRGGERGRRPHPDHRRLDARPARATRSTASTPPPDRCGRSAGSRSRSRTHRRRRSAGSCISSAAAGTPWARRPRPCGRSIRARAPSKRRQAAPAAVGHGVAVDRRSDRRRRRARADDHGGRRR